MLLLVALVCPFGVKLGLFTARIFSHVTQSHLLSTQKVAHFSFHLPLCSVRFLTANQKAFILYLFFFHFCEHGDSFYGQVWATYRIAWAIQISSTRFCFAGVETEKSNPTCIDNCLALIVSCLLFTYPSSLKEVH